MSYIKYSQGLFLLSPKFKTDDRFWKLLVACPSSGTTTKFTWLTHCAGRNARYPLRLIWRKTRLLWATWLVPQKHQAGSCTLFVGMLTNRQGDKRFVLWRQNVLFLRPVIGNVSYFLLFPFFLSALVSIFISCPLPFFLFFLFGFLLETLSQDSKEQIIK